MRWPRWRWPSWWGWLWRQPYSDHDDAKAVRHQAEQKLRVTRRETAAVERAANQFAGLPTEEYLDRIAAAFGRRHQ